MFQSQRACVKRRWRGLAVSFLNDRNGSNAVEFGIVAAPFIALVVGTIQTFMVFWGQQLLEQVVDQSARFILTNQAQTANWSQTDFKNKVCQQIVVVFSCTNLMVNVQSSSTWAAASTSSPTLTFDSNGNVTNTWAYNPGGPGDIVVVELMYQWPVFTGPLGFSLANLPNGNHLLKASAAFQNEP